MINMNNTYNIEKIKKSITDSFDDIDDMGIDVDIDDEQAGDISFDISGEEPIPSSPLPDVRHGDLYRLGEHRLLCGDGQHAPCGDDGEAVFLHGA